MLLQALPFLLILVGGTFADYDGNGRENHSLNSSVEDIGILRSYMTVEGEVPCGKVEINCYDRGSGNNNCRRGPSESVHCSWNFVAGAATKFWCQAWWRDEYGSTVASLNEFAVFGDGVPKKSSKWQVNKHGKVRLTEDGVEQNDLRGSWTIHKEDVSML